MRLIDANEALEIIDNYKNSISMTAKTEVAVSAIEDIVKCICPTIDAEPVVHGHWVKDHDTKHLLWFCKCSACDREITKDLLGRWPLTKYCPNCGAKMDEEQE